MYDLIIIGAGPAGLTAGIYAKRSKLNVLVIGKTEQMACWGDHTIENYPGMPKATGRQIGEAMKAQAHDLEIEVSPQSVRQAIKNADIFSVLTSQNETYEAKSLIIATGIERKKLVIAGEEEFLGKGVSYCATCDGFFFKDKIVAVTGQGEEMKHAVEYMANIASKVYVISEEETSFVQKNIEVVSGEIKEVQGGKSVERVLLADGEELEVNGLFIELGSVPASKWLGDLGLDMEGNFIKVDSSQATNIPGVFAAGDITTGSNNLRQVATAVGEGAVAAMAVYRWVRPASIDK